MPPEAGDAWLRTGWQVYPAEQGVRDWLDTSGPAAIAATRDASLRARWLRHGGTWFVGVDALDNDAEGRVGQGAPLRCEALKQARDATGAHALHPGQVSAVWPGYPGRDPEESDAAHRFRRHRAGAHLDGLLPMGSRKRRHLVEPHAFILGIAVTSAGTEAAPLVVWEGSHRIMRRTFASLFEGQDPTRWPEIDVTDAYKAARAEVFETCPRREVPLKRGETALVHRHAIHGIAPWDAADATEADARITIWFRPEVSRRGDWLALP